MSEFKQIVYAFPEMRPQQVKVIDEIMAAFKDYKYVMLEMPTGTGKSGVVMSVALSMNDYEPTSYVNTASKLLQDQYLNDFKGFTRTIKGRSNFDCNDPDTDERIRQKCDTGRCMLSSDYKCRIKPGQHQYDVEFRGLKDKEQIFYDKVKIPPSPSYSGSDYGNYGPRRSNNAKAGLIIKHPCLYYDQKMKGLATGHTVSNYEWFFSSLFYTDSLTNRDLLVFDEAHNLENKIIDFISLHIYPNYYDKFAKALLNEYLSQNVEIPDASVGMEDDVMVWSEYLRYTVIWMKKVWNYYDGMNVNQETAKTLSKFEKAMKKTEHIQMLISKKYDNWIVDFAADKSIKISPIETGEYIKNIFGIANKVLFVSATLLDKRVYANMIGVPEEEIIFIRVNESPFPINNRLIHLENIGEMRYANMDSLMPAIAASVDNILTEHCYDKGIIHCTNYKQVDYIKNNLSPHNKRRLTLTKSGTQQSEVIKSHNAKENSVLLSPSMSEGVDLKDSMSRFQIIVKVPFMPINDKRISIKMKKSTTWYQWYACLKIMQMYGRSVRNDEDYAVTYILDSKVNDLIRNKLITGWFKEAIV